LEHQQRADAAVEVWLRLGCCFSAKRIRVVDQTAERSDALPARSFTENPGSLSWATVLQELNMNTYKAIQPF